ncbi:hypothetical protein DFQ05_1142 [Winogradskyella wandonensis]|uniref:Uncharacterized protein n=1 Tax=Winogradskyella wandonensis TaxID=1442586 RepID=A0A4R1KQR6_9FLAO|nr:hypothetical protein [Winogradskyella wandonensis]TCK67368.1 hypothetical protein DFQ05_1142 [Winogradskyella wandonensis]
MHGNSMNVSVQNNLKLLQNRNRDKFKNVLGGYKSSKKTEYNLPKASAKQLRDIRKRMQAERKIWWLKAVALTIIASSILVVMMFVI